MNMKLGVRYKMYLIEFNDWDILNFYVINMLNCIVKLINKINDYIRDNGETNMQKIMK